MEHSKLTSTRRPIIYPSGKIIAHDSRYIKKGLKYETHL